MRAKVLLFRAPAGGRWLLQIQLLPAEEDETEEEAIFAEAASTGSAGEPAAEPAAEPDSPPPPELAPDGLDGGPPAWPQQWFNGVPMLDGVYVASVHLCADFAPPRPKERPRVLHPTRCRQLPALDSAVVAVIEAGVEVEVLAVQELVGGGGMRVHVAGQTKKGERYRGWVSRIAKTGEVLLDCCRPPQVSHGLQLQSLWIIPNAAES